HKFQKPRSTELLLARAGEMSLRAGRPADARDRIEAAIGIYDELGDSEGTARIGLLLSNVDVGQGRLIEAERRLEAALASLEPAGPSPELAATLASLGRMQILRGEEHPASENIERALRLAEALALEEVIVDALTTRGVALTFQGRHVESVLILEGALGRAREAELHAPQRRAYSNLLVVMMDAGRFTDALGLIQESEAHARQRGDRDALVDSLLSAVAPLGALGRWEEVLARVAEADEMEASMWARSERLPVVDILCDRGEVDRARVVLEEHEAARHAEQRDIAAAFAAAEARLLCAEQRYPEARAAAERGLSHADALGGIFTSTVRLCLFQAIEATLALDDLDDAERMLDAIDRLMPGQLFPVVRAPGLSLRARVDARRGNLDDAERELEAAERLFAGEGMVFGVARTQIERAELLAGRDRLEEAGDLAARSRETFERLRATPWVARADGLRAPELAPSGSSA
ncbi:MAG: hypothetical protein ACJ768_14780, partial [Gaiellaceae bacterium]